jgi:hypothetical protein
MMPYRPLTTTRAPKSIRDFVATHIDMQFADVHAMLRLPLTDDGLEAGCNFACVSTLCRLIAGASTIFYKQTGFNGERFKGVLNDYYPWPMQPKGGVPQTEAVAALYSEYRNPLAHAWAVSTKEVGKHQNKRVIMDGSAKVFGVVKQALTEEAVAALETPTGRAPSWFTPVVMRNSAGGLDLYPHSLYWGTRRMVEKLTRDRARMRQTAALFATMTPPAP